MTDVCHRYFFLQIPHRPQFVTVTNGFSQTHHIENIGMMLVNIRIDISELHFKLVDFNGSHVPFTSKMKFGMLTFLYCAEFVKNPNRYILHLV